MKRSEKERKERKVSGYIFQLCGLEFLMAKDCIQQTIPAPLGIFHSSWLLAKEGWLANGGELQVI